MNLLTLFAICCLSLGIQGLPTSDISTSELGYQFQALAERVAKKRLLFDSLSTPVDVSGNHAFVAPDFAAGDQRGPCPGLNALANHGFIPHNGVVSLLEATEASNEVYGMGLDLAASLAILGTVWVGNPLSLNPSLSIGGPTDSVTNLADSLLGLLGTPRGLLGSHNIIEGDSSNTRNDLYMTGDAWMMNMTKFMAWYNMSSDPTRAYNMDIIAERTNTRFEESVAENPNFYYGPFTSLIARNAGYIFASRVLANHSSENPEGLLSTSPIDYGLVQLNLDIVTMVLKYPQLGSVGGNTGTANSFAGVDIANLTGGIYEATILLENNNLLCFAFQIVKLAAPNSLSSLFSVLEVPLQLVTDFLGTALLNMSCPAFTDLTVGGDGFLEGLERLYPGVQKSGFAF